MVSVSSNSGRQANSVTERDALRQWQILTVIDGGGLASHVNLPRIAATLAAAAGFFFTPEGAANFRTAGADVDVGNAAIAAASGQEQFGLAHVIGKNRGTQSLRDL